MEINSSRNHQLFKQEEPSPSPTPSQHLAFTLRAIPFNQIRSPLKERLIIIKKKKDLLQEREINFLKKGSTTKYLFNQISAPLFSGPLGPLMVHPPTHTHYLMSIGTHLILTLIRLIYCWIGKTIVVEKLRIMGLWVSRFDGAFFFFFLVEPRPTMRFLGHPNSHAFKWGPRWAHITYGGQGVHLSLIVG